MQKKKETKQLNSVMALIIIIMEICKAPILRLKALNKRNITHIMGIVIQYNTILLSLCREICFLEMMEMLSAIKMFKFLSY